MPITSARLILAVTLLVFLTAPDFAQSAPEESDPTASDTSEPAEVCHKGIKRSGRPSKLSKVASLSAIRLWAQAATKFGDNYSMWHNAKSSGVKCEKFVNSDYYRCTASGKPCRAVSLDQATSDNLSN